METATRGALHRAGAAVLKELLAAPAEFLGQVPCRCGQQARYHEMRPKQWVTMLGPVETERPYYVGPHCRQGQSPRDQELDVEGTEYSPGVRRMMAVVGSATSLEPGREQLELRAGLQVTTQAVERPAATIGAAIAAPEQAAIQQGVPAELPAVEGPEIPVLYIERDGTGAPMVSSATEGRAGKQGEQARPREVKLGCVFTQTTVDARRRPVRDEASTPYTGGIETAQAFGRRMSVQAYRRGWNRAKKKVVLGEGALWIRNLTEEHFPEAIQIVDLYHARQHLGELSAKLGPTDQRRRTQQTQPWENKLKRGQSGSLVRDLRSLSPATIEAAEGVRREADYFAANAQRMRYPAFRRQHLFVGSGVIEAGCKTIVGTRRKRSGMFWTVRGANAIIALRCHRLSGEFENYWESRRPRAA
ncbi:MAG TPA: ISKra4 family transposase [Candidatus Acidoferrum sp.]|nr:ISKra4 family transposase [Candidatus Acidoferrum sp.]